MKYLLPIPLLFLSICNIAQIQNPADNAVTMTTSTDNLFICPDKKEGYLYIDLAAIGASKRIPLNISLVLDRSGSMHEERRLHNAKIAINYLIDQLGPEDICSIVIYDHYAEILHPAMPVTDKDYLKKTISKIEPRGHTNIYGGLQLGYDEVKRNYAPEKINRVILLSDGLANEGITDDYMLEMVVKDHSYREGISLSTLGMGHEFNETLMHNMAEYGGGNYYFVEQATDAINDFGNEIKMLSGVVARAGVLNIQFPGNVVRVEKFFGFHHTNSVNGIRVDLKEIHPNERNAMLVKFNFMQPLPDSITFTTTLQYINVMTNKSVLKSENVVIRNSNGTQDCITGFRPDVINKIALFTSNYYIDSAADHAERGDFKSAHKTLESAKVLHKNTTGNDPKLNQQYQLIDEYDTELEKNKSGHPTKLKLLHKKIRHKNYKIRKGKCPVL